MCIHALSAHLSVCLCAHEYVCVCRFISTFLYETVDSDRFIIFLMCHNLLTVPLTLSSKFVCQPCDTRIELGVRGDSSAIDVDRVQGSGLCVVSVRSTLGSVSVVRLGWPAARLPWQKL